VPADKRKHSMKDDQNLGKDRAAEIAFGLDRATDERSLALFLTRFSRPEVLEVLLPRLSDPELLGLVDQLSVLLKKHLREGEYHRLFLRDR
jgi:hypothetical protein